MDDKTITGEYNDSGEGNENMPETACGQDGDKINNTKQIQSVSARSIEIDEYTFTDMKEYPENLFSYFETNKIDIQLANGSFQYLVQDFVLPGRNGFDVSISRRYDSGCANLTDMSSTSNNLGVRTATRNNDHNTRTYGLGYGWSFALPSIESIPYKQYATYADTNRPAVINMQSYVLHLEDGRNIQMTGGGSGFEDYTLEDISFTNASGKIKHSCIHSLEKNYHQVLEYKNGNKDYFAKFARYGELDDYQTTPHYKLIAREDRFGNVIFFELNDYGGMTITDTWGREIKLEKNAAGLMWTLPGAETGKTSGLYYKINYQSNTQKPSELIAATDLMNNETRYEYYDPNVYSGLMELGTLSVQYTTGTKARKFMLLKTIRYPGGGMTQFNFDKSKKIKILDGLGGYITHFPLISRYNEVNEDIYNQIEYSYTLSKRSRYIEKAEVSYRNGISEHYVFSQKGQVKKKEIKENTKMISGIEYKYYDDRLMESAEEKLFGKDDSSKIIEKKTTYASWILGNRDDIQFISMF